MQLSAVKTAADLLTQIYEFGKSLKDRELKRKVDEIYDKLRDLKQAASELEDENRELRERLRFKSEEFEFNQPFYYERSHPTRPLCVKCFAKSIPAPMGEPGHECRSNYRRCLVCGDTVQIGPDAPLQKPRRRY